ncbi:MAG: dienelactone hydrolase family protein, partial [Thermomicrobiales bacterium]|nr:dienelactone hydrolase family protein [Thermomicrobiales bacterium]
PNGNRACLAVPPGGSGPGVLVLHAWWGLTPVFTNVCDRLAENGFVALAPGLYPNGETTDSIDEAEKLVDASDRAPGVAGGIAFAGVDHLRGLAAVTGDGIGVIGFSMGAYWALHLSEARPDDVRAVVAVYGTSDSDFSAARAAYLGHFAAQDDFEPIESVRTLESSLRDAGRDVTFHIYPDTGHWFFEPNRPDVYNAEAAELVWERTLAFLHRQIG